MPETGPGAAPAGAAAPPDIRAGMRRDAAVRALQRAFAVAGLDTPGLDARLLAAAALGIDQAALLASGEAGLDGRAAHRMAALAQRRLGREPVSRILGRRWFHGLELEIGPATLDPRPETETLVDGVLQTLRAAGAGRVVPPAAATGEGLRILDLGTGSGAILAALLAALPQACGVGLDISDEALTVARRNADRHGIGCRAAFRLSHWLDGLGPDEQFDVVVSNPPYIPRADIAELAPEVRCFDPLAALDGGADGLDAVRIILAATRNHLAPGGLLALEIGAGQAGLVERAALVEPWLVPEPADEHWYDLGGHRRCVAFRARISPDGKNLLAKPCNPARVGMAHMLRRPGAIGEEPATGAMSAGPDENARSFPASVDGSRSEESSR